MQILATTLCELWHSPQSAVSQVTPAKNIPPPGIARPMHPDLVHDPPPEELVQILPGSMPQSRDQEIVYTGSKFRFFRDGGGLPSPGHTRPDRRPKPLLLGLVDIWWETLRTTSSPTYARDENQPPLPPDIILELRRAT
eukprot:2637365-Amphidinium_carterae.1